MADTPDERLERVQRKVDEVRARLPERPGMTAEDPDEPRFYEETEIDDTDDGPLTGTP